MQRRSFMVATEQFIQQLRRKPGRHKAYAGLELVFHDVSSDQAQAARVSRLISQHRVAGASVPITSLCDQLVVGFETKESFEARLLKALQVWTHACPQANDGLNRYRRR